MHRRLLAAAVVAVTIPMLSGCVLLGSIVPEPVNDRPAVTGPDGWTEFDSCPTGPRDEWVWIDGSPSEELEAAGIAPECADTWLQDDGDNFVGIVDSGMVFEQFDALRDAMIAAGWEVTYDDLVPGDERGPVGWRDYELDGGETTLILEVYNDGTDPASYTAYADFRSPGTRALG